MLSKVWSGIIICSLLFSLITGNYSRMIPGALETGGECISLMLTLLASMSFFNGLVKLADAGGLTKKISAVLYYPLHLLFPEIPKNHIAFSQMSINITANILGMGNAATPAGISAMKSIMSLNTDKTVASRAACLFAVMNTSSIQLIPTTIIALRINYGSSSPFIIMLPIIISSITGLIAGICAVNIFERRTEYGGNKNSIGNSDTGYIYDSNNICREKKGRRFFMFFARRKREY